MPDRETTCDRTLNKGDKLRERFIQLSRIFPYLGMVFCASLLLPAPGRAAWPVHGHPLVQPVLITALALTSLVLFLIYVFIRRQARTKTCHNPDNCPKDLREKTTEADQVLTRLFDTQEFPMAKLNLDQTRILDITSPLATALGYSRTVCLQKNAAELGLVRDRSRQQLLEQGWQEFEARLFDPQTRQNVPCRILSIAIRSGEPPFIMSIVSGLSGTSSSEPFPGCINDILGKKAMSQ